MKAVCSICGIELPEENRRIRSTQHHGVFYCAYGDWQACEDRSLSRGNDETVAPNKPRAAA